MIELRYSLVIEATGDPEYFSFYSIELQGFSGAGHSVEDCLNKANSAIAEHVGLLEELGLPVPPLNPNPRIVIESAPLQLYLC